MTLHTMTEQNDGNDTYGIAYARSKIRELQWAILFAKSEPEYFPPSFDPDVGEMRPVYNYEPFHRVSWLVIQIMKDPNAMSMLAPFGWTEADDYSDLDTMLSHLPPITMVPALQTA